jgi:carbonic anhydrase
MAFRDVEDVKAAVHLFVQNYTDNWLIDKMRFHSPPQTRRAHDVDRKAAQRNFMPQEPRPAKYHVRLCTPKVDQNAEWSCTSLKEPEQARVRPFEVEYDGHWRPTEAGNTEF